MNIAIISLPLHQNYGGILQSYALQEFLVQQGHNVTLLDRRRNHSDENIGSRIYNYISQDILHRNVQKFISQHIHRSPKITSQSSLNEIAKDFDAVIVGSDQVWRLSMIKGVETNYFLDFVPDSCRKIAYSASFGTTQWEGTDVLTKKIVPLAKRFDAISVRESDGVDMCRNLFGVEAVHTVDPVLLHKKEFYVSTLLDSDNSEENGLFYYFLGPNEEKRQGVEMLSDRLGLTPFSVTPKWKFRIGKFEFSSVPGPKDWVDSFRRAKFILTDSFHGVAFSIIFNKPFVVLPHKSGGLSRIHSVLSQFGLESRLHNSETLGRLTNDELMNMDFSKVNDLVDQARAFSAEYLIKNISR